MKVLLPRNHSMCDTLDRKTPQARNRLKVRRSVLCRSSLGLQLFIFVLLDPLCACMHWMTLQHL